MLQTVPHAFFLTSGRARSASISMCCSISGFACSPDYAVLPRFLSALLAVALEGSAASSRAVWWPAMQLVDSIACANLQPGSAPAAPAPVQPPALVKQAAQGITEVGFLELSIWHALHFRLRPKPFSSPSHVQPIASWVLPGYAWSAR